MAEGGSPRFHFIRYQNNPQIPEQTFDQEIEKLLYIPGLQKVITCGRDSVATLWSVSETSPIRRLKGHQAPVLNALHVPQHKRLFTSSVDCTFVTWDDYSFAKRHQWGTVAAQMCFSVTRDASRMIGGGTDGSLCVWDLSEVDKVNMHQTKVEGHKDWVMAIGALEDRDWLCTASLDRTVKLWDRNTLIFHRELAGHTKGVTSVAYSLEYGLLMSAGSDRDVLLWSPVVKGVLHRLKGHEKPLVGVETVDTTPEIITADAGGVIKIWDIRTFGCLQTLGRSGSAGSSRETMLDMCYCSQQKCIVTANKSLRTVHLGFHWLQGEVVEPTFKTSIHTLLYLPNSRRNASGSSRNIRRQSTGDDRQLEDTYGRILVGSGKELSLWSTEFGKLEKIVQRFFKAEITSVDFAPCGGENGEDELWVAMKDCNVVCLETTEWNVLAKFRAGNDPLAFLRRLYDPRRLLTATNRGLVKILDLTEGRTQRVVPGTQWRSMQRDVSQALYYESRELLALISVHYAEIRHAPTGSLKARLSSPNDIADSVFAEGLGYFICFDINHFIHFWSLDDYQLKFSVHTLTREERLFGRLPISRVAFATTSHELISDNDEHQIVVWDIDAMIKAGEAMDATHGPPYVVPPRDDGAVVCVGRGSLGHVVQFDPSFRKHTHKAHNEVVTCLVYFDVGPRAIVSGTYDGKVKLISPTGKLYGQLSMEGDSYWCFPAAKFAAAAQKELVSRKLPIIPSAQTQQHTTVRPQPTMESLCPFYTLWKAAKREEDEEEQRRKGLSGDISLLHLRSRSTSPTKNRSTKEKERYARFFDDSPFRKSRDMLKLPKSSHYP
eukprot:Rmarinus@m.8401